MIAFFTEWFMYHMFHDYFLYGFLLASNIYLNKMRVRSNLHFKLMLSLLNGANVCLHRNVLEITEKKYMYRDN